jgi:hypothetical protein
MRSDEFDNNQYERGDGEYHHDLYCLQTLLILAEAYDRSDGSTGHG